MTLTAPPARRTTTQTALALGVVTVGVLAGVAAVAAAVGVAITGAVTPSLLVDPGPLVRWGLPVVSTAGDLAAAATLGALVLAAVALPVTRPAPPAGRPAGRPDARVRPGRGPRRGSPRAYRPALALACAAAGLWALVTVVRLVLTYADVSGRALDDPAFGDELVFFVRTIDLGRGLAITAAVAAAVALLAAGAASLRAAGLLTLLACVGLVPAALSGHSASAGAHETAVTSLGLHLLGLCVWVGGLLGLTLLRPVLVTQHGGHALATSVRRFSPLALWSFVLVALSGVVNAALRLEGLRDLSTPYGRVVLAKGVALGLLGAAGWWHRRHALEALDAGRGSAFTRLVAAELAVMSVAVGLAAALARTAPPVPEVRAAAPSAAEVLTGYPLPPEPTPVRWLTSWQPDLLWVLLTALMAGLYVAGLVRLRRRGDRWPVLRTLSWLAGVAAVVVVTCGPPMVYGRVLFSAHMVGHMTLSMVAPMFLVLGAPVTLALRALHPRPDGSRGAREWLVAVLESGFLRVVAHPVVAAFLFSGSLVIFYYSPLFELALTTHVGHELMHLHFLLAGYVFMWVLVGVDPGPHRPSYPLRLVLLFSTMAFHAFFGISLISSTEVLQPAYFGGLGREWGRALLADQVYGGGLAWGLGEVPTIAVAVVLAVQWARSDARDARRADRRADRDGDADLVAYNAMLAGLAARDEAAVRDEAADRAEEAASGSAARAARDSKGA